MEPSPPQHVVLVTGPSGAGRSTAINALEDLGFETIDNLPLSLIDRLLSSGSAVERSLALGIDARNRDFSTDAVVALIEDLTRRPDISADLLFLDATPAILLNRYSETRRRHPLAPEETPAAGIAREIELLRPVRDRAERLIDTSEMTPHDLRAEIAQLFDSRADYGLAVSVQSFSYKRGLPRGVDLVFDLRFLRNPHWEPSLRARDGRDVEVATFVMEDPRFAQFFRQLSELVIDHLPAYRAEGKAHLAVAMGCTGGQHRSVAVAEKLAATVAEAGWRVSVRHRELERRNAMAPPTDMKGTGP